MSNKDLHHDLNELKALNMQGILIHLSTKEDLYQAKSELRSEIISVKTDLREEINTVKSDLKEEINNVKSDLREEINNVKSNLKEEINNVKSELSEKIEKNDLSLKEVKNLLKWMNRFIITTLTGVILGLTKLFFLH